MSAAQVLYVQMENNLSNMMMISDETRFQYGALNAFNENTFRCMLGN